MMGAQVLSAASLPQRPGPLACTRGYPTGLEVIPYQLPNGTALDLYR